MRNQVKWEYQEQATYSPGITIPSLDEWEKIVIGKKVLAAGQIEPREALEYAAGFVYGVAIGVTSSQELKETFSIAKEIWSL